MGRARPRPMLLFGGMDSDVSRREFPGSEELFDKIDTDGDGLISALEATKADALVRKQR